MSIRCGSMLPLALLVLPLSLATSACADDDGVETMIGATDARAPFVNRLTSITPPRVKAVVLPNATCPQLPLVAPFTLFVERRSFPFEFPFGCGVVPPGTLTIVVITADEHRRERRTSLEVAVD